MYSFGEIIINDEIDFEEIVRKGIKEVGYISTDIGMNYQTANMIVDD